MICYLSGTRRISFRRSVMNSIEKLVEGLGSGFRSHGVSESTIKTPHVLDRLPEI